MCCTCEAAFIDRASIQQGDDFYKVEYHQTYFARIDPDVVNPSKHHKKMVKVMKPWIDRIKKVITENDTVLGVGSSSGYNLYQLKHYVKRVCGIEPNDKERTFCINSLGLDIRDGLDGIKEENFSIILLLFVLEHISEPVHFLKSLARFLKPGGKIIILVPHIKDPLVSFYDIPEFQKFYFCIEHLFYFSKKSMEIILEEVGLKGRISVEQEYPIVNHLNWAYLSKPFEPIKARKNIPALPIKENTELDKWEKFWENIDTEYKKFLRANGYGDRLFCIAEKS